MHHDYVRLAMIHKSTDTAPVLLAEGCANEPDKTSTTLQTYIKQSMYDANSRSHDSYCISTGCDSPHHSLIHLTVSVLYNRCVTNA